MPINPCHHFRIRFTGPLLAAVAALSVVGTGPAATAESSPGSAISVETARRDGLPRKVMVATVVSGDDVYQTSLENRLKKMNEFVDSAASDVRWNYPGKRLDLFVLPEAFIARPGATVALQVIRLAEVQDAVGACARRHNCYLVAPMLLDESGATTRLTNAAVLFDRAGKVVGIYRKVHPVAPQGSDSVEMGTTPGGEFPVFDCDFGRLGIQICFDMLYSDGWAALARKGAEIVALPSASPETIRPSSYARENHYYIVSAVPRNHAAVYSPVGLVEAEATKEGATMVHQIDLSYEVLHWEAVLEEGEGLRKKFGDRVGFLYYRRQDSGIFWSNDPGMPIARMVASLGLVDSDANAERVRVLQDRARGGPPPSP